MPPEGSTAARGRHMLPAASGPEDIQFLVLLLFRKHPQNIRCDCSPISMLRAIRAMKNNCLERRQYSKLSMLSETLAARSTCMLKLQVVSIYAYTERRTVYTGENMKRHSLKSLSTQRYNQRGKCQVKSPQA